MRRGSPLFDTPGVMVDRTVINALTTGETLPTATTTR